MFHWFKTQLTKESLPGTMPWNCWLVNNLTLSWTGLVKILKLQRIITRKERMQWRKHQFHLSAHHFYITRPFILLLLLIRNTIFHRVRHITSLIDRSILSNTFCKAKLLRWDLLYERVKCITYCHYKALFLPLMSIHLHEQCRELKSCCLFRSISAVCTIVSC